MDNQQVNTPLVSQLQQLAKRDHASFYTPGHKRGRGISPALKQLMGEKVFQADLPELPELDNLFAPNGVIKAAQELAAQTFGAEQTWFLVNGSTAGIIASIWATCKDGDKIILPRNAHQSAIFGLILSGATPIFINPKYNSDFDLFYGICPKDLEHTLELHPDAKAVMVVYPTYEGICSDLIAIANLTHQYNIPLIVDEAHGAHFHFHPQLPPSALSLGADIAIQSTHKVLSAMTQASMLHLQGNLVNPTLINQGLQLLQSSSPNYLLLASLDSARQQMATEGKSLLGKTLDLALTARTKLQQFDYLPILDLNQSRGDFAYLDNTRLTIRVSDLGLTGYTADEILHQYLGVTCELPSLTNLTFIISLGNQSQDIERLIEGLRELKKYRNKNRTKPTITLPPFPHNRLAFSPRQAYQANKTSMEINSSVNHICLEVICPYPPGIPLLIPGEIITQPVLDYIHAVLSCGGIISGAKDTSLRTIQVSI